MKNLISAILLIALPQFALATDRAQLRALATEFDTAAVEAAVAAAHDAYRTGDLSADGLRDLFGIFFTTDPAIWEFAEYWLEDFPDSPYPHAAFAALYSNAAWHMRGQAEIHFTYTQALMQFGDLRQRSTVMARAADSWAPDFGPLLDVMTTNLYSEGLADNYTPFLDRIMAVAPNHGSLIRFIEGVQPKWGGSLDAVVEICARHADKVHDVAGYNADICLTEAALMFDFGPELRQRAIRALRKYKVAVLEPLRIEVIQPGMTPGRDRQIRDYLELPETTDWELARDFDYTVSKPAGLPPLLPDVRARFLAKAHADLAEDPNNPDLIHEILLSQGYENGEGTGVGLDEAVALAERALETGPYDPRSWYMIGMLYDRADHEGLDPRENAYFTNAIAYSMHSGEYLNLVLNAKMQDYFAGAIRPGDPETPADIQAQFDMAVTCPAMRLVSFVEQLCRPGSTCESVGGSRDGFDRIRQDAERRNVCEPERTGDIRSLFFEPAGIK